MTIELLKQDQYLVKIFKHWQKLNGLKSSVISTTIRKLTHVVKLKSP